jgi:amphiphysin
MIIWANLARMRKYELILQVEQDFELAAGEYEHYNNLLKQELPHFLQLGTKFIDPLFHSFYYMQYVPTFLLFDTQKSTA